MLQKAVAKARSTPKLHICACTSFAVIADSLCKLAWHGMVALGGLGGLLPATAKEVGYSRLQDSSSPLHLHALLMDNHRL